MEEEANAFKMLKISKAIARAKLNEKLRETREQIEKARMECDRAILTAQETYLDTMKKLKKP